MLLQKLFVFCVHVVLCQAATRTTTTATVAEDISDLLDRGGGGCGVMVYDRIGCSALERYCFATVQTY